MKIRNIVAPKTNRQKQKQRKDAALFLTNCEVIFHVKCCQHQRKLFENLDDNLGTDSNGAISGNFSNWTDVYCKCY